VLAVLTLPVTGLRLGFGDAGNRPTTDTTRRAYDLLADGFGPGFNGPLLLVAQAPRGQGDQAARPGWPEPCARRPGWPSPPTRSPTGPATPPSSRSSPTTAPQDQAAGGLDFADYTASRLPWFVGTVLLLSFLLLLAAFRSLLVPLKAVAMNLLSIGAAYGVVVAVFQWGWGASLIGVGRPGPVEAWAPMMLFAILFGLSMDYEVFLLSRIREHYDRGRDNTAAVAGGLAATARVITAAAAIMVVVFAGFVLGDDRSIKLFGLGLAVAVLLDATIVRLVLVPAAMQLLGDRNWWLPGWLGRHLPPPRRCRPAWGPPWPGPAHSATGAGRPAVAADPTGGAVPCSPGSWISPGAACRVAGGIAATSAADPGPPGRSACAPSVAAGSTAA
jgi:putative drug exporter of the RND superfamily